jgi:hypothetical protein
LALVPSLTAANCKDETPHSNLVLMAFCVSRGKLFIFISNSLEPFTICVVGVVMFSVGYDVSIAPTFRN